MVQSSSNSIHSLLGRVVQPHAQHDRQDEQVHRRSRPLQVRTRPRLPRFLRDRPRPRPRPPHLDRNHQHQNTPTHNQGPLERARPAIAPHGPPLCFRRRRSLRHFLHEPHSASKWNSPSASVTTETCRASHAMACVNALGPLAQAIENKQRCLDRPMMG